MKLFSEHQALKSYIRTQTFSENMGIKLSVKVLTHRDNPISLTKVVKPRCSGKEPFSIFL